jgi:sigma-B regulation protein RsbU (phosphoserine phosphatase)
MTEVRPQPPAGVDVDLLAQIVQVSADGIFCQDLDGTLISWNAGAERVYGYQAQEVLGLHGDLLMPAETRGQLQLAHRAALAGDRVERFDTSTSAVTARGSR